MKRMNIFKELCVLFFAAAIFHASYAADDQITKTIPVEKGGTLKITTLTGDITIRPWDKLEVSVKIDGVSENESNQISISKSGNTVTVLNNSGWGWGGSHDIVVDLPTEFNVSISTNQGDIEFRGNLKGNAAVKTGSGDIVSKNITGTAELTTNGGDLHIGDIGNNSKLLTRGGDIIIGNLGKNCRVSTMGGDVKTANSLGDIDVNTFGGDIKVGNVAGDAKIKTLGGSISIGKVNGSVTCTTNGGNINLSGASGEVKAKTFGGSLTLKNINGSIDASTAAGDVYVELNPKVNTFSKISTSNGRITLYIPSSSKAEISANVSTYDDGGDNAKNIIQSDFPAQSFDANEYSPNVSAKYIINGGGASIKLNAVNEKIVIKKSR